MKTATFFDHLKQACAQTGRPLEELLSFAVSCGICGLDISYPDLLRHRDLLKSFCAENNFAISCVYETFDLANSADTTGAHELIDCAADFGVERLLIIPGFIDGASAARLHALHASEADTFACMNGLAPVQNIRAALTDLVSYAAARNILITLEDYDSDSAPFSRIFQLLYFMKKVPGLKTTFDMGNFAYADEDALEAYRVLAPYIVHVHCKDRDTEQSVRGIPCTELRFCKGLAPAAAGSGYLPIAELLCRLEADRYDGYYVIEHFDAPDQLGFLRRSAEFLREQERHFPHAASN